MTKRQVILYLTIIAASIACTIIRVVGSEDVNVSTEGNVEVSTDTIVIVK